MANRKAIVPAELALDAAEYKKESGARNRVVPVSSSTEVYVKDDGGLVVRRVGRGGARITSKRAKALKQCKGKRGADALSCIRTALGTAPSSMEATGGRAKYSTQVYEKTGATWTPGSRGE